MFIYIISSYMHPRIFNSNIFFKENSTAVISTMTIWVEALFKTGNITVESSLFLGINVRAFCGIPFHAILRSEKRIKILRIVWHCTAINNLQRDLYHSEPANYWQSTNIDPPPPIRNDIRCIFSAIVAIFILVRSDEKYLFYWTMIFKLLDFLHVDLWTFK